ncbi:MAG: helix-hairpin-helix domain-containing protein [Prolixibacteraceae bacterium]|nr:helix-hairpin-helix domain-containing protein [Prolixibacteraceae bacterium]
MHHPFSSFIKKYFTFSKKDRNGIIVLVVLILFAILTGIVVDYIPVNDEVDYSEFEKAFNEWEMAKENNTQNNQTLFPFNPNTISETSLDSLLLPEYVKRNLINYRKAGGKIKTVSGFRKIYGMNDSIYAAVEEYIEIPGEPLQPEERGRDKTEKTENNFPPSEAIKQKEDGESYTRYVIELNSADSSELVKLNGVGPVFASRIVKFRDLLGGFYSGEQLLEVYNFPEETYNSVASHVTVDTSGINKIRINFAGYSDLIRHPYLNKKQVQSIINYRTRNGALKSVEDLLRLNLVDSVTYRKVKPYLSSR